MCAWIRMMTAVVTTGAVGGKDEVSELESELGGGVEETAADAANTEPFERFKSLVTKPVVATSTHSGK